MSLTETVKNAARRSAKRVALRVAFAGVAATVAGLRAFGGADASEAPAGAAAPTAAAHAADADSATPSVRAVATVGAIANAAGAAPAAGGPAAAAPVAAAPNDSGGALAALGRETFMYAGHGRRDPFASLLKAGGDLRPQLTDLRLVTVLVGSNGRNSVAIMRDLTTKEQYRRRAGESLGRMRVASIQPRQVVFTIEEFGYSRQEVLMYTDSTTTRTR